MRGSCLHGLINQSLASHPTANGLQLHLTKYNEVPQKSRKHSGNYVDLSRENYTVSAFSIWMIDGFLAPGSGVLHMKSGAKV